MSEIERAALEHIHSVVEAALNASPQTSSPAPTPTSASTLLSVPYVSQIGPGANTYTYDSGAAVGAMFVRAYTSQTPSVDEFFQSSRQSAEKPLTLQQISATLSQYGVAVDGRAGMKLSDLLMALASFRPVILLVKQLTLHDAGLTPETLDGPHYLVAVGADAENIYVHDPLRKDTSGQGQPIPFTTLLEAWTLIAHDLNVPGLERSGLLAHHPLKRIVTPTTLLNVRGDSAPDAPVVGQVNTGDLFEICTIKNGFGQISEGKWINMQYVKDL